MMKRTILFLASFVSLMTVSCTNMDLNPKDQAATGNWYKNAEQFDMCLNALLHQMYWPMERNEWGDSEQIELDLLTDDGTNRSTLSRYLKDGVDGSFPLSSQMWNISYKGINRCNKIIRELPAAKDNIPESKYNEILGNVKFYRACFYARIIAHFGNPVFVDEKMDFDRKEDREAAYNLSRSDRWEFSDWVISEFEEAAGLLPEAYVSGEVQRATKGSAWGMESRFALHIASIRKWDTFGLGDEAEANRLFDIAAKSAKKVIDLDRYTLHENFGELFRMRTHNSPEAIFVLPRSKSLSAENKYEYLYKGATTAKLPRLSGAATCCTCCPSWDLLCAFYDNQGKPIDESSVYNPAKPFENRDPRCSMTIVEHGTEHLGVIYEPCFDVPKVMGRDGKMTDNNDSRTYLISGTGNQYASYNGLVLRKHVDEDWLSPFEAENDKIILRYADVLEMYAEAKIELGDIDASVLDAMNAVRARAYGIKDITSGGYPKITETDQASLRRILRAERRMEFAWENRRLYDIWRWRIAEKVLNAANYGLPAKNEKNQRRYMDDGMWFMGAVPRIDENDCPDFTVTVRGNDQFFTSGKYAVKLSQRKFVAPKSYLWPLPTTTTNVMPELAKDNNVGY